MLIQFFHLGLWGAWIALVADQLLRNVLMTARYRSGGWKALSLAHTLRATRADA